MITPPGIPGVVFGTRSDGDARSDTDARSVFSSRFGIPTEWATIHQVHGSTVARATVPGHLGDADAVVTDRHGLPIVIATADCVPVVLIGERTRAVAHAGWRGVASGVVDEAVAAISDMGDEVVTAVIGPHIGPCCYEVGDEVIEAVGGYASRTRDGRLSVDLAAALKDQLAGIDVVEVGMCTLDDPEMASYRQDGTHDRQVTVAWLPTD